MTSLRALARWAADCAEQALPCFESRVPGDGRPRQAIDGARVFAAGGKRTAVLRRVALAAYAAARETRDPVASAAAHAACLAASSAYTHPLADARQTVHVVGPAAYAALALELAEEEAHAVIPADPGGGACLRMPDDAGPGLNPTAGDELVRWAVTHVPHAVYAILNQMPQRSPKKKRLDAFLFRLDEGVRNRSENTAVETEG